MDNLTHNQRIWRDVTRILAEGARKIRQFDQQEKKRIAAAQRPPHGNKFSRYVQKANAPITVCEEVPRRELRPDTNYALFESWMLVPNKQLAAPFGAYHGKSGKDEQTVAGQNWQRHKLVKWNAQQHILPPLVIASPKNHPQIYVAQHKRIQYFQRRHYG